MRVKRPGPRWPLRIRHSVEGDTPSSLARRTCSPRVERSMSRGAAGSRPEPQQCLHDRTTGMPGVGTAAGCSGVAVLGMALTGEEYSRHAGGSEC